MLIGNSEEKHVLGSLLSTNNNNHKGGLITKNTSLITNCFSTLSSGLDTCSFLGEPSLSTIIAIGGNYESAGAIAYNGSESCGSVAYSGSGEACGSIASSTSTSSCGSSCSFSC